MKECLVGNRHSWIKEDPTALEVNSAEPLPIEWGACFKYPTPVASLTYIVRAPHIIRIRYRQNSAIDFCDSTGKKSQDLFSHSRTPLHSPFTMLPTFLVTLLAVASTQTNGRSLESRSKAPSFKQCLDPENTNANMVMHIPCITMGSFNNIELSCITLVRRRSHTSWTQLTIAVR